MHTLCKVCVSPMARLGLMVTRVEMIDKVESFLEGRGFEFKCLGVQVSGVREYIGLVEAVLVVTVADGGVHELSCPWLHGKTTWDHGMTPSAKSAGSKTRFTQNQFTERPVCEL